MRRRYLLQILAALPWLAGAELRGALAGRRLGMVIHSFSQRWRGKYSSVKQPPFRDVLDVMDYLRDLGVHRLQIGLDSGWDMELAQKARATSESYDMRLEGMIRLPQGAADLDRFQRELRIGREAGMEIFRVAAGGRRYELFHQREDFEAWKTRVTEALEQAEPIAAKLGLRLAVENHKDFETDELVELMQRLSSPAVGVCLDTGNNLALLEDPLEVVQKLAPYTFTVHLKDIAVGMAEDGFQMSETVLGAGMLPLMEMIRILNTRVPQAELNLEMLTRDPLLIPCLREDYWATFPQKSGRDLARTLSLVRAHITEKPLPKVSGLSQEEKLTLEEKNVLGSILVAAEKLGFSQVQMKTIQDLEER